METLEKTNKKTQQNETAGGLPAHATETVRLKPCAAGLCVKVPEPYMSSCASYVYLLYDVNRRQTGSCRPGLGGCQSVHVSRALLGLHETQKIT